LLPRPTNTTLFPYTTLFRSSNPMKNVPQVAFTLNLPVGEKNLETVRTLRQKLRDLRYLPPRRVDSGPVMENVLQGNDIDLFKFPDRKSTRLNSSHRTISYAV